MKTFSALLAICAGNSPVTGEFPAQRQVTGSFDIIFDMHLNKRLSKQSRGWWFETPLCPLWRHCNVFHHSINPIKAANDPSTCTCHNSLPVVACAKLWLDEQINFHIGTIHIYCYKTRFISSWTVCVMGLTLVSQIHNIWSLHVLIACFISVCANKTIFYYRNTQSIPGCQALYVNCVVTKFRRQCLKILILRPVTLMIFFLSHSKFYGNFVLVLSLFNHSDSYKILHMPQQHSDLMTSNP